MPQRFYDELKLIFGRKRWNETFKDIINELGSTAVNIERLVTWRKCEFQ